MPISVNNGHGRAYRGGMMQLLLLALFVTWDYARPHGVGDVELTRNLMHSFAAVTLGLFIEKFFRWLRDR